MHSGQSQVKEGKRGRPPLGARQAILDSARQMLSEEGLAHLTTREVAKRAGVSEASVFYHFQDKAGLLVSCVHEALGPLKRTPLDLEEGETLRQYLGRLSDAHTAFYSDVMPLLSTVHADIVLRREFADRLVDGDHGVHEGVTAVSCQLATLVEAGLVDPDADLAAAAFLLVSECFLRSWQSQLDGDRRESRLPTDGRILDALAELLRPRRPPNNERTTKTDRKRTR